MTKLGISFSVVALTAVTLAMPVAAQDLGIEVGKRAPSAVVTTLDGKAVDIGAYVGKVPVFLEFWATWCPRCHELEPALLAVEKKYGARMKFIGVAVSVNQTPARVKAYTAKHGLKHLIVFDTQGNAADAYDAPATSYVVVVNRSGKVVYTGLGGDQNLEAAIKKAL